MESAKKHNIVKKVLMPEDDFLICSIYRSNNDVKYDWHI